MRILFIGDDSDDARRIAHAIGDGEAGVARAESVAAAVEALAAAPADAVVLDARVSDGTDADATSLSRLREACGEAPLLVLAGIDGAQHVARAICDGPRDVLLANRADGARLISAIRRTNELERSNQDLQQFAYVASHDMQEPLRMVKSYLQLLAQRYEGKLDSEADEFIGYAVDGAARMQRMIDDLLAYSRVQTKGKEFAPADCETALDGALRNLQLAIQESHAEITRDPLPTISADHAQLCQLFQNLVGNALKFHGQEPPRIHIAAERRDGAWLFSVRDNGIGVPPDRAGEVFTIFKRLHSRGEYPGSGIGLAVCKRIVERHGGRIWVEAANPGATFYCTMTVPEETAEHVAA